MISRRQENIKDASGDAMNLHACPICGAQYSSPLAAALCGDDDMEQDLHARQALRGRGKK